MIVLKKQFVDMEAELFPPHLIGGVPGHDTGIRHTGRDHRLGAGDKPSVIKDQDDRVILGVCKPVTQVLFCTRTQKHPSLTFCLLTSSLNTIYVRGVVKITVCTLVVTKSSQMLSWKLAISEHPVMLWKKTIIFSRGNKINTRYENAEY